MLRVPMKKHIFCFALSAAIFSVAQAEGYVGVSRSKGQLALGCNNAEQCKKGSEILKFYAGTKLSSSDQIDIGGVAVIDAVEIGYWRGNKSQASGQVSATTINEEGDLVLAGAEGNNFTVPGKVRLGFDAMILSGVARLPLGDGFSAFGKLGIAYVSATKRVELDGKSSRSTTAGVFRPYLGLGVDYELLPNLRLGAQFDMSAYAVGAEKGNIKSLGVGAELNY
jgi:hypothetical protein